MCIDFSECCHYTTIRSIGRCQVLKCSKGFSEIFFRLRYSSICVPGGWSSLPMNFPVLAVGRGKMNIWNCPKYCLFPLFDPIYSKHCWIFQWWGSWYTRWWDYVLHQLWCHLILKSPHSHGSDWRGFPPVAGDPMPCACSQSSFQGPQPWFCHTIERDNQAYLARLCYKNRPYHCLKFQGISVQILLWSAF